MCKERPPMTPIKKTVFITIKRDYSYHNLFKPQQLKLLKSQYKLLKIKGTKLIFVIIVLDNVLVFLSVRDVGGRVSNVATWRVQESGWLAVPQIPHTKNEKLSRTLYNRKTMYIV